MNSALPSDPRLSNRRRRQQGFTLIEVIAVLVLISVVSAIIIRNSSFTSNAALFGAVETVKSHLRYAQSRAMNSDVSWGINFSGSTYTLRDANGNTDTLPSPVPTGMTFASTINPVLFDTKWGSPGTSTITITVSNSGGSQSFTITKNTGFIP